jgi:ureidoglycolate dehydrogenase (NAD+)
MLSEKRVGADRLRESVSHLFEDKGLGWEHSTFVADTLVCTSLLGVDTHGLRLLPTYIKEVDGGRANACPRFRTYGELSAVATFDADNALGIVAANAAMRALIDRTRVSGLSAMVVANSNHFGAAGYYARLAASAGQIGIVFTNSDALVAPASGRVALNGTNPIAMAAPANGDDGFFLDMATSQVAFSKVLHAMNAEAEIESGWARDASGLDASLSRNVATLQPLGGYKGQALGTMVQILCSLLASTPFDFQLSHLYGEPYCHPRKTAHFMLNIEISAFVPLIEFKSRLSELLNTFRTSAVAPGADSVLVAGDPERSSLSYRAVNGIPLSDAEWEILAPYF